MQVRYALATTSFICLILLFGVSAGCGNNAVDEAIEESPSIDDTDDVAEEAVADDTADDVEADDVDATDEDELPDDEEDLERRHLGAWITRGGQLEGSQFVFMPGGRAQMGTERMMLSGEYTIDHDREMPYLYILIEVMGRTVESHYFVEYLPDDRLRFHTVEPDPDAPGEFRVQERGHVLTLERNE